MNNRKIQSIALIGASAIVSLGAIAVSITTDRDSVITNVGSGMSTGATVTESLAPSTAPVEDAKPAIKGPAPLPPEEQGLPG